MREKLKNQIIALITSQLGATEDDTKLWNQVHTNANDIETLRKSTEDVLPTLTAIWGNPVFEPYRTKK